ncbi:MAG: monovalent cation/H(+) antiporter subunit G [Verrucomicrobiaceae bacterium]|nr:MAG: monovalent cation/H(+) antiporter subunit G [Verrucomicrobiaceae bacterium]
MMTTVASLFLLIGGFFALVAALGVYRFPDFYARIHAATKASTFGFGFTVLAAALALGTPSAWVKAVAAIAFLFITLPIAAHLLARSVRASGKKGPPAG